MSTRRSEVAKLRRYCAIGEAIIKAITEGENVKTLTDAITITAEVAEDQVSDRDYEDEFVGALAYLATQYVQMQGQLAAFTNDQGPLPLVLESARNIADRMADQ